MEKTVIERTTPFRSPNAGVPRPNYPKNRKRSPRKINASRVLKLAELGMPKVDIAKSQGVRPNTIWRFLDQHRAHVQAIGVFKEKRADLLAGLQAKVLDVQSRIIETLDDGVIRGLKAQAKTGLLMALNATSGTSFDKERLERGQSTSNQSVMSLMVDNTIKGLYDQSASVASKKKGRASKQVVQAAPQAADSLSSTTT